MQSAPIIIEKGIVQPTFGKIERSSLFRINILTGGVLTPEGEPVPQSAVIVNERELVRPLPVRLSEFEIPYTDVDVIYFCVPQNHFGHVLTGTMAFAHILQDTSYRNHKIVFTAFPPAHLEPWSPIRELLQALGVHNEDIWSINEYTQFRTVVVVEPSLRCTRLSRFRRRLFAIDPEFVEIFRTISRRFYENGSPDKVYFSRSMIAHRPIAMEHKIEEIFRKNGYLIVHPEQIALAEQIRLVAGADYYVCLQGTLEHHSVFMKEGATFVAISRKSVRTVRQVLIDRMQRTTLRQFYLRGHIHPFGDKISPNIAGVTGDLIRFFDAHHFVYDADDWRLSDRERDEYVASCTWRDIPLPDWFLKKILSIYLRIYQRLSAGRY